MTLAPMENVRSRQGGYEAHLWLPVLRTPRLHEEETSDAGEAFSI